MHPIPVKFPSKEAKNSSSGSAILDSTYLGALVCIRVVILSNLKLAQSSNVVGQFQEHSFLAAVISFLWCRYELKMPSCTVPDCNIMSEKDQERSIINNISPVAYMKFRPSKAVAQPALP